MLHRLNSSTPSLNSSSTISTQTSRDSEPEGELYYSDEEHQGEAGEEGNEPGEHHEGEGEDSHLHEEWYVDTGYLDKVDKLASKLEYAARTMEFAINRLSRMSERLEVAMVEMRRAIDIMTGREIENDDSVSKGLFEMTVTHLLDRIRRYEIVDFIDKVYAEGRRMGESTGREEL